MSNQTILAIDKTPLMVAVLQTMAFYLLYLTHKFESHYIILN